MDFIEQEAECCDCSDSSSSNDKQDDDLEGFTDYQEYDNDEEMFANVVKLIDKEDPQPRLYNKNLVDGRETDNFKQDKYRAEEFRKSLLCFPTAEHEERNLFFRPSYMEFITWIIRIAQHQILRLPAVLSGQT